MSEAEFMEDGSEYCNIYSQDDEDENVGCTRQTCDGCLCTNWCPLFCDPFKD